MRVVFHFSRPLQKPPKVSPLPEHEFPKLQEPDLRHFHSAISFNPPEQVRAAPRRKMMPARGIPQEPQHMAHGMMISDASLRKRLAQKRRGWRGSSCMLESIILHNHRCPMPDDKARQKAEDHYYAALDLVAEGQLERALVEYQQSLDADPTFTEAMHGIARALQDLNRIDAAIAVAKRISELDPDDVLAHTSLSVLYQKKGMIPEA